LSGGEEIGAGTSASNLNPRSIFIYGCFWRMMTTMTDGTSNTAVFSEKAIGGVDYCVTSGESPFGVWGALGSVNGGESTAP
jgi:hypothetical protein